MFHVCNLQAKAPLRCYAAASTESATLQAIEATGSDVRVRFAPSPTGTLHVGGARTALFNWLYAKNQGGKLILRIEDTDAARSTRESEELVLRDLKWLGLNWDEGPDIGGPHGPYRQSERKDLYRSYVDKLVADGVAYPCFCTDEELEAMKKDAEEKKLPPIYRGKWATASSEEVAAEMAKGTPYCYRFRVPKNNIITINDIVRGEVSWNTDTLGDFVLLRSNGLPVYNFCVAVDDASMRITHVLRAEEHLPNTLRQVLIYKALGFPTPTFGHMSLILAPDKSKLSKRHGATSVGEFKEEGYLAAAMVNFLSLLGWNDGTEQEIFTVDELSEKFALDRITKSGAVFDKTKLGWMNGQHLRALPEEQLQSMLGERWVEAGMLTKNASPFVSAVVGVVRNSLELVHDADNELRDLLGYPLEETLSSEGAKAFVDDNLAEVVGAILASYDSGDLATAIAAGHDGYKKWINGIGKALGRKGKRLFMPARIALTGRMQGPDVGEVLSMLALEDGDVVGDKGLYVALPERMERLRAWHQAQPEA
jgi:glutamyl-tRNA synthetase